MPFYFTSDSEARNSWFLKRLKIGTPVIWKRIREIDIIYGYFSILCVSFSSAKTRRHVQFSSYTCGFCLCVRHSFVFNLTALVSTLYIQHSIICIFLPYPRRKCTRTYRHKTVGPPWIIPIYLWCKCLFCIYILICVFFNRFLEDIIMNKINDYN